MSRQNRKIRSKALATVCYPGDVVCFGWLMAIAHGHGYVDSIDEYALTGSQRYIPRNERLLVLAATEPIFKHRCDYVSQALLVCSPTKGYGWTLVCHETYRHMSLQRGFKPKKKPSWLERKEFISAVNKAVSFGALPGGNAFQYIPTEGMVVRPLKLHDPTQQLGPYGQTHWLKSPADTLVGLSSKRSDSFDVKFEVMKHRSPRPVTIDIDLSYSPDMPVLSRP